MYIHYENLEQDLSLVELENEVEFTMRSKTQLGREIFPSINRLTLKDFSNIQVTLTNLFTISDILITDLLRCNISLIKTVLNT